MEEIAIAVVAFAIGFILGNLSKLELREILKRVARNGKKNR